MNSKDIYALALVRTFKREYVQIHDAMIHNAIL